MKTIATLVMLFILFSFNTFAQDYTQLGLPEGAKARLGKDGISGNIAYSPDGARLVVASLIGIWLYDTATHQVANSRNGEVALLTGHTGGVASVAYSPAGSTLAGGSDDGTVRMWDTQTGALLRTLTGHTGGVSVGVYGPEGSTLTGHTGGVASVAYSPAGSTLASGSNDDTVRMWDIQTGALLRTLTGHTN